MLFNVLNFRKFLQDTDGAITVDYVVLTAAATGVALASSDAVIDSLSSLSDTVAGELSGQDVSDTVIGLVYSNGFDNGAYGWVGASADNIEGVGNVLGPIAGSSGAQSVSKQFDIDPNAESTTITFDLLALDSHDNESGIIFLDGLEIGKVTSNLGQTVFTASDNLEGITIAGDVVDNFVHLGGNTQWKDSKTQITITVDDPGASLDFGFGSTANQSVNDESFALDNFSITGLLDPDA